MKKRANVVRTSEGQIISFGTPFTNLIPSTKEPKDRRKIEVSTTYFLYYFVIYSLLRYSRIIGDKMKIYVFNLFKIRNVYILYVLSATTIYPRQQENEIDLYLV